MRILFLLYDGILNSVFHSQVFVPLVEKLDRDENLEILLISFEKNKFSIPQKYLLHPRLKIVVLKRHRFCGKLGLLLEVGAFFRRFDRLDVSRVIARGPMAGWIGKKICKQLGCSLTVQARGLAAEEFLYALEKNGGGLIKRLLKKRIYRSYEQIEREVYGKGEANPNCRSSSIEAVSSELKRFLVKSFGADEGAITIAQDDIPKRIDREQVRRWRDEVREQLGIATDAYVYVYAGSARSWQCVDEMIGCFGQKSLEDARAFFLVFSQDKDVFEKKLVDARIRSSAYLVKSVSHAEIYKFLSAADAGLLFREDHVVNRVARPTKLLEYEAVGLKVVRGLNT